MPEQYFTKKYIRYTTRGRDGNSREEAGLFVSAYRLRDDSSLPAAEQQELQQCLRWFEQHVRLACLDESSALDQQARCWYKNPDYSAHVAEHKVGVARRDVDPAAEASAFPEATARQALSQTERLAELMRRYGFMVHIEQTDRPGVILHQHGIQVTAIPACNTWHSLRLRLQIWWERHSSAAGL